MADIPGMLARLSEPAPSDRPVAWGRGEGVSDRAFRGRVAAWIAAIDRSPGSTIALYQTDGVEFAAALFGAWYSGRTVFVPGDNLPGTFRQLESRVALFAGEWPLAKSIVQRDAADMTGTSLTKLDALFPGLVVFTSGSTGAPHAIPKCLGQLASEVGTLERTFGATLAGADIVSTVSHHHIYGLLFKVLWPLTSGRTFLSRSLEFPEEVVEALGPRKAALITSATLLKRLPPGINWQRVREHVVAVYTSGGPLPRAAALLSEELLGRTPVEVLGSSETGGIAIRQQTRGTDSSWTPFDGVAVRNEAGLLAVRSGNLPNDEWFTTEDRAVFTSDGQFRLDGRADRIVKVEGIRVSLAAVERALAECEWVADARVFAMQGNRDQLAAVVIPTHEGRLALQRDGRGVVTRTLRAILGGSTERVALPRRWRFVDAFPVNGQGKITQDALIALFREGTPTLPIVTSTERASNHVVIRMRVPEDLAYFDGHFPDEPILPGVVQVHWAIHYGRAHFEMPKTFQRLETIKFHRVIRPNADLTLELDWRAHRASLAYAFRSPIGPYSSGRVIFGP